MAKFNIEKVARGVIDAFEPKRVYIYLNHEANTICGQAHYWIATGERDKGTAIFKCKKCGLIMSEPSALMQHDLQKICIRRRNKEFVKKIAIEPIEAINVLDEII